MWPSPPKQCFAIAIAAIEPITGACQISSFSSPFPPIVCEGRQYAKSKPVTAALPSEIVIGLPVNMNGKEGPRAKKAREFGALVEEAAGLPVKYWDERLTSMQAAEILKGRGARKRKAKIDVISAQLILQSYLDARGRRGEHTRIPPPLEGGG